MGFFFLLAEPTVCAQAPDWQMVMATSEGEYESPTITAAATDAGGNVVLVGYFTGTVTFGASTLTSIGKADVFVAKWNPTTSSYVWVQQAGSVDNDYAYAVAISGKNVYVAGSFEGAAKFGPTVVTSAGFSDAFVAKLTDEGVTSSFAWVQQAGGLYSDQATALAVNGVSVYLAGAVGATATFSKIVVRNSTYSHDAFVAKLTDAGTSANFVWAQGAGGTDDEEWATGVAVSGTSVYLVGYFEGVRANFGDTTLINSGVGHYNYNSDDLFVAKLTDAGAASSFVWAQQAGSPGADDRATAVVASGSSVYVAGFFGGPANLGTTLLTSVGGAVVAKLTDAATSGSFTWVQQVSGSGEELANALAVKGPNIYVAGSFNGRTATVGIGFIVSDGGFDLFVAKLIDAGSTGSFAWAQRAGGRGNDSAAALAVSGANIYVAGVVSPPARFGNLNILNTKSKTVGFLASLAESPLASSSAKWLFGVELYPNPAHGTALVHVPAVSGGTVTLTLADALGRTVSTQQMALPATGARAKIYLAGLSPGLYRLMVQVGSQHMTRALAVE